MDPNPLWTHYTKRGDPVSVTFDTFRKIYPPILSGLRLEEIKS